MNRGKNAVVSAILVSDKKLKNKNVTSKKLIIKRGRPSYMSIYTAAMQSLNRINEAELEAVKANTMRILLEQKN